MKNQSVLNAIGIALFHPIITI